MKLERTIEGRRYVGTAEPNGDGSYSLSVYVCTRTGFDHLPAHDDLAMNRQAASDRLSAIMANIAVAATMPAIASAVREGLHEA